jgi:dihydroneopterin aldolase
MTDRILLERIAVHAFHGVLPEEAKLGQQFFISLTAEADLSKAGQSDDYRQTICYARMTEIAVSITTGQRFQLIEALAETIAAALLAEFPIMEKITVRIDKPSAPIPATFANVSVEITRARTGQ